jgi:glycosyltransferase involved in cell wall biosynthesis
VKVSIVVSTIGRAPRLDALFASLHEQRQRPHEVIVVDQSPGGVARGVVADHRGLLPLTYLESAAVGASAGRNLGIRSCTGDVVGFPDDDCVYPPETLATLVGLLACAPGVDIVAGRLVGSEGLSRLSFPPMPSVLHRRNVWSCAIEATTFLRRAVLRNVGAFDEDLGVGSSGPWQSGEGTDLILRALAAGHRALYTPEISIRELGPPPDLASAAYAAKARRYARGTGRVFRKHPYTPWERAATVIRPLGAAGFALTVGRDRGRAGRYAQVALGRAEGLGWLTPATGADG